MLDFIDLLMLALDGFCSQLQNTLLRDLEKVSTILLCGGVTSTKPPRTSVGRQGNMSVLMTEMKVQVEFFTAQSPTFNFLYCSFYNFGMLKCAICTKGNISSRLEQF